MNLRHFFISIESGTVPGKTAVILLRGNQYPLLLCSLLVERLAKTLDLRIECIDVYLHDEAKLALQSTITFLGERSLYWLYNGIALEGSKKKSIEKLLAQYEGPNCLVFFSSSTLTCVNPCALIVDIPDMCDKELFLALVLFCEGALTENMRLFTQQLFASVQHIPFDTACIMVQYAKLLGAHYTVFMKHWLGNFVSNEHSLFTLSQHLFAKNGRSFFTLWTEFSSEYPDVFWTSFWSEQLWRAAVYIRLIQNNNRIEAEKIGHRLPFSFKNKGWSRWDPVELITAHSFLQDIDRIVKNGGTVFNIEFFYTKFFAHDFSIK